MGYVVFTNVVGQQEAVKGSHELRCSIYELYSIACQISLIVSVRSGIIDLLIPSGISMFVLYDTSDNFMREAYRLDGWNSECKIHEAFIDTPDDIKSIPEKFSVFLDELKQEGRIS